MTRWRRPAPSLVRRLTITFLLTNAGVVLLFLVSALYPAALLEEDEPVGPDLILQRLADDLAINAAGKLALRPNAGIAALAGRHPNLWFVADAGAEGLEYGPVPAIARDNAVRPGPAAYQARYHRFGFAGQEGEAATAPLLIDGRSVRATAGGIAASRIGFGEFLTYIWRDAWFVVPLTLAIFTLIGGLIAIPITLRSVRSTARAAAAFDPADLARRLPEAGVVTELLPIVRAVNTALDRVSQAFERRRRFIADVAHELRTPLAVLTMHVEALPEGAARAQLQRTVFRLGQMVGQMLDAERLALASRRRDPVDLTALARDAVAEIAPLAVAAGYDVALSAPPDPVCVEGDWHALSRAVTNLLGNAVAHGGGQGTIEVRIAPPGQLDVADQGPGIPAESRARIFEPFHRERWDRDGCGLGLHLVAEVMRAHGGTATVLGSDQGAVFRLDFHPLAARRDGGRDRD